MENLANSQPICSEPPLHPFTFSLPPKNHPQPQNYFSKQHYRYYPSQCYHPYWGAPDDYHFAQQYFHNHQLYWNQIFMNQRILNPKEFNESKQRKTEPPAVKIQHQESPQNDQNSHQLRHPRRKYKLHKKNRKNNASYYWSTDQNKRYSDFLCQNGLLFSMSLSQKKNLRVNVMMSKKVKSRTPQQCHSHHQKMMKKYGSIENIVQVMKKDREESQKKNPDTTGGAQAQDQVPKDHIKQQREIDQ